MNWASGEVVGVLTFLLPGFVAAAVFYSLTSHPKPDAFDRVVQALIFTVIGNAITTVFVSWVKSSKMKMPGGSSLGSLSCQSWSQLRSPLLAAYVSNTDSIHGFLRRLGVTKETSYPSGWYSAFSQHGDCYVVLHLKGQRRLYGWPEEWPRHPEEGHFRISEGEWLVDDKRIPAEGVAAILIPGSEVEMVEFLSGTT